MKKRKFITHVSMGCTNEQYERDLKKTLEYLGYKDCNSEWYEGYKFITNNWDGKNSSIGSSHESLIKLLGGYFIDHYNPKLFLALAAMTEGKEPVGGEYCHWNGSRPLRFCKVENQTAGENYKFNSEFNHCHISRIVKATKEELINHFAKDMKTKESRFPFELDLEGARKIIDVACSDWKQKLIKGWGEPYLLGKNIHITKPFYKEMRAACNDEQHKVLDSVFGKDEKSVEDELYNIFIDYCIDADARNYTNKLLETFDIKFKE